MIALPPFSERISLVEAAAMFDPPKTRRAIEQLVARGKLEGALLDDASTARCQ